MDPNAALESILRGHMMLEHVEALRDWIRGGGFEPAATWRPVDVVPCLASLPSQTAISANKTGITHMAFNGHAYVLAFRWSELERMAREHEAD